MYNLVSIIKKKLNFSRQHSMISQKSVSLPTNINTNKKDQDPYNIGERLIETEETETGSVSFHEH